MTQTEGPISYRLNDELFAEFALVETFVTTAGRAAAERVRSIVARHVHAHYPEATVLIGFIDQDNTGEPVMRFRELHGPNDTVILDLDDDEDLQSVVEPLLDGLAASKFGYHDHGDDGWVAVDLDDEADLPRFQLDEVLHMVRVEAPENDTLVSCSECSEDLDGTEDPHCEVAEDGEHVSDQELHDPPDVDPTRQIRVEWVVRVPNDGYQYFPDVVGRLERMGALLLLDPYASSVTTGGQGGSAWVEDVERDEEANAHDGTE